MPDDLKWIKSSFSPSGNSCVWMTREHDGSLRMRDEHGHELTINDDEWRAFVLGVVHGDFNALAK